METENIYWKTILKKIENSEKIENVEADFNNETVLWKNAMILGENGIEVPQKLIDYDDENIDYSDIPPITDEDLTSGKIKWTISNVNEFTTKLIRNF